MQDTVTVEMIPIESLPPTLGAPPWSDQGEWPVANFTWNIVRRIYGADIYRGARIHRQEQADLESIAYDGLRWNLSRYRQAVFQRTDPRDVRRFAAAFLVGCLVRSMLARKRSVAVVVGTMIVDLGYREAAAATWNAIIPSVKNKSNGGFLNEHRTS